MEWNGFVRVIRFIITKLDFPVRSHTALFEHQATLLFCLAAGVCVSYLLSNFNLSYVY